MPQDHDQDQDASAFSLSNILKPGSSLHPTFLIIVDCVFLLLLLIFLTLAILTSGNIHVLILMTIELCLWASIKWFIAELQVESVPPQEQATTLQEKKLH